jgi:hypothetical protein
VLDGWKPALGFCAHLEIDLCNAQRGFGARFVAFPFVFFGGLCLFGEEFRERRTLFLMGDRLVSRGVLLGCETAGATVAAAKLTDATRARMVVWILVLSISRASCERNWFV